MASSSSNSQNNGSSGKPAASGARGAGASAGDSAGASGKPSIFLLGVSGHLGQAILNALNHECADECKVQVGAREPKDVEQHKSSTTQKIQHAEMSDPKSLPSKLKNVDVLFIVNPGDQDRPHLTEQTIDACVEANVKFIMVVSTVTAHTKTIFGEQFGSIENHLKSSKAQHWCILRLPVFLETFLHFSDTIKRTQSIVAPVKGDVQFTPVSVDDVGLVAAKVLTNWQKYSGQTLTVTMNPLTFNELADAFSKVLGKKITYKELSNQEFKQQLQKRGLHEKEINAILEYYSFMEQGKKEYINCPNNTIKEVGGKNPINPQEWISQHKNEFISSGAA